MPKSEIKVNPSSSLSLVIASFIWMASIQSAPAATDPASICDAAARRIAAETGVPLSVLRRLTHADADLTGDRAMNPWPWTIAIEGKGIWFDNENQAMHHVFQHFKTGLRRFKIGCLQINYATDAAAFSTIEDMFDPVLNTRHAARILMEMRAETGGWTQASIAYLLRTGQQRDGVVARYSDGSMARPSSTGRALRRLPQTTDRHPSPPLSQTSSTRSTLGSLVPTGPARKNSLLAKNNG